MQNSRKVIKLCRILTEVSIALLIIITVFLPFGISWYVETMHRSQTLPATVMVTCYPCAPFVGIALFMLAEYSYAHMTACSLRAPTQRI